MKLRITLTRKILQIIETMQKSRSFQKIVQLFNLMRTMLLALSSNTSRRNKAKQQLENIFQLEIIRD